MPTLHPSAPLSSYPGTDPGEHGGPKEGKGGKGKERKGKKGCCCCCKERKGRKKGKERKERVEVLVLLLLLLRFMVMVAWMDACMDDKGVDVVVVAMVAWVDAWMHGWMTSHTQTRQIERARDLLGRKEG